MVKYCLSYDIKKSDDWDSEKLKKEIVIELTLAGAINFHSPVGSTILFEDERDNPRVNYWSKKINDSFEDEIFYYLCIVAPLQDGKLGEINQGDPDLEKRFQELIRTLG